MKLDTRVEIYVIYICWKIRFFVVIERFIVSVILSVRKNKEIKVKKNIKKISA